MVHSLCPGLELHGVGNLFTATALIILSIQDIKYGEIHYRYLLLMVDFQYIEGYIFLVVTVIFYKWVEKFIGGADLLIFGFLIVRYGLFDTSLILFYAAVLGLSYAIVFRKQMLRFIPFIFFGFIFYIKGG